MKDAALPHELQVGRFLEARAEEIKALENELVRTGKGKLASQQVASSHSFDIASSPLIIP